MPDLERLVELNYLSMGIVMVLVFGLVALGIPCAFAIFLIKGLREYGILKAMGVRPMECAGLVLAQVGLLSLTAAAAGTLLGMLLVAVTARTGIDVTALTSHNRCFVVSGVIIPRLTAFSAGLPPLLALVFSLVAALWPIAIIGRARAAEILRTL
jgi:ABC-type lipoprotein release transport system permease subunit